MFGGACWMPIALRTSTSTTLIFRNEVVITTASGTSATMDSASARVMGS